MIPLKELQFLIFGVIAAAIIYIWMRGFRGIGSDIVSGAADVVEGAAEESVETIADVIGIPETDLTECELAMKEGRTLDASFACPAGVFLSYLFSDDETENSEAAS